MLDYFISQNTGKVVSYDNVPSAAGQSPQLIAAWCAHIGLPFQWANPADWWDDSDETFLEHWDKVVNDRKNADQLPNPGDIVIFDGSLPGSGGFGHATIFVRNVGPNSWVGFDANWGGRSAHLQNHNWSYALGWFTPKNRGVTQQAIPTAIAGEAPSEAYELQEIDDKTVTLKNDANLYNLKDVDWESFQANVQGYERKGKDLVVRAIARHRLGGTYYLPDPKKPYGFRVIDCDDHDRSGQAIIDPEEKVEKKKLDHLPKAPVIAPIKDPIEIGKPIPKYASMGDAVNGVNSTGNLEPGLYFPHKYLEGMIALAKEPGTPLGCWIDPDDLLSAEEKLKKNWRTTYKPFRNQYGEVEPRYYRALNEDAVPDLEQRRKDLAISRKQPILIRGWFVGPDGTVYGRPDDCVSNGQLSWYGVRRNNLERISDPTIEEVPQEPEMVIYSEPIPTFRDKLESIVPEGFKGIFDVLKSKV